MKNHRSCASAAGVCGRARRRGTQRSEQVMTVRCFWLCSGFGADHGDDFAVHGVVSLDDDGDDEGGVEMLMTEREREALRQSELQIELEIAQRIAQDAVLNQTRAIMRCVLCYYGLPCSSVSNAYVCCRYTFCCSVAKSQPRSARSLNRRATRTSARSFRWTRMTTTSLSSPATKPTTTPTFRSSRPLTRPHQHKRTAALRRPTLITRRTRASASCSRSARTASAPTTFRSAWYAFHFHFRIEAVILEETWR